MFGIDPDQRMEGQIAAHIRSMTATVKPIVWGFYTREMYSPTAYRVDGVWGNKLRYRLFPLLDGQIFSPQTYHGPWCPQNKEYKKINSGFNLYHLKMITRERRIARRDLYRELDPDNEYQRIGYDYLADDYGAVLEEIPPGREYSPPHREDQSLWMPDPRGPQTQPSRTG